MRAVAQVVLILAVLASPAVSGQVLTEPPRIDSRGPYPRHREIYIAKLAERWRPGFDVNCRGWNHPSDLFTIERGEAGWYCLCVFDAGPKRWQIQSITPLRPRL